MVSYQRLHRWQLLLTPPYNQGDTTVAVGAPTRSAPAGVMTDTKGRGSVFKLAHYVDW